jgi:hypothetical protein
MARIKSLQKVFVNSVSQSAENQRLICVNPENLRPIFLSLVKACHLVIPGGQSGLKMAELAVKL